MSDFPSDSSLDAQLRNVPLPENFLARMKGGLAPADHEIDARLSDVRVPPLMLARLRMVPADLAVDDSLGEISLPLSLTWRLRSVPGPNRWRQLREYGGKLATAAALFLTVSLTLFSMLGALLTSIYPQAVPDDLGFAVIYEGPLLLDLAAAEVAPEVTLDSLALVEIAPEAQAAALPSFVSLPNASIRIVDPEFVNQTTGPVAEWTALVRGGLRSFDDVVLLRYGILGAPQKLDDELPDLESLRLVSARGIEPPRTRGYNREFFLKHRLHPPIAPGAAPALRSIAVPLTMEDYSYRRVESLLRQSGWP